jgi:hypothetical protein
VARDVLWKARGTVTHDWASGPQQCGAVDEMRTEEMGQASDSILILFAVRMAREIRRDGIDCRLSARRESGCWGVIRGRVGRLSAAATPSFGIGASRFYSAQDVAFGWGAFSKKDGAESTETTTAGGRGRQRWRAELYGGRTGGWGAGEDGEREGGGGGRWVGEWEEGAADSGVDEQ